MITTTIKVTTVIIIIVIIIATHPASFALILDGLFRVLLGRFHVVDRLLNVVLNAINHLSLEQHATICRLTSYENKLDTAQCV